MTTTNRTALIASLACASWCFTPPVVAADTAMRVGSAAEAPYSSVFLANRDAPLATTDQAISHADFRGLGFDTAVLSGDTYSTISASNIGLVASQDGDGTSRTAWKTRWFGAELVLSQTETNLLTDSTKYCAGFFSGVGAVVGFGLGGPAGAVLGMPIGAGAGSLLCAPSSIAATAAKHSNRCLKIKISYVGLNVPHAGTCLKH